MKIILRLLIYFGCLVLLSSCSWNYTVDLWGFAVLLWTKDFNSIWVYLIILLGQNMKKNLLTWIFWTAANYYFDPSKDVWYLICCVICLSFLVTDPEPVKVQQPSAPAPSVKKEVSPRQKLPQKKQVKDAIEAEDFLPVSIAS